jgi:hypothetical protein
MRLRSCKVDTHACTGDMCFFVGLVDIGMRVPNFSMLGSGAVCSPARLRSRQDSRFFKCKCRAGLWMFKGLEVYLSVRRSLSKAIRSRTIQSTSIAQEQKHLVPLKVNNDPARQFIGSLSVCLPLPPTNCCRPRLEGGDKASSPTEIALLRRDPSPHGPGTHSTVVH